MAAFPGGGNTLQFPNLPGNTNYGANNSPQLGGVTTSDWRLFFGDPKGPIDTSALGPFKRENFALPDAYKGSLPYMTNLIITLVTDEDMWPTKIALPFRLTEGEMEIVWDEIVFNNSLLGPVPEEGVSRLVTQQVAERRDHYVRYGLALMLEHGFMRTEKGRTCYRMNLEQIRNAILETAYIGVLEAYLACKLPGVQSAAKYRYALTGTRLGNALVQEVEDFACVQKTEHGFDLLDARAKRLMRGLSIKPDMWVLPEGLKIYLTNVRRENFDYLIAGPQGPATFASRGSAVDKANDCMIFEAKQFELPGEARPVDVLQRRAVIGEYYVMQNHLRGGVDPVKYRSNMRDIFIYNEDKDGFSRVSLETALRNCCRFHDDGELDWNDVGVPGMGQRLEDDWTFGGGDGVPRDMFAHQVEGSDGNDRMAPTRFFGDMHENHLRDDGLTDWAESVAAKLKATFPSMEEVLRLGADLVNAIDTPIAGNPAYFAILREVHTNPAAAARGWDEDNKIPEIPGIVAGAVANFNPVGYSNWAGISLLAKDTYKDAFPKIHDMASKFVVEFERFYMELEKRLPGCVLLDKTYTPEWFGKKDGRSTLFTNLFHPDVVPLTLLVTAGGANEPAALAAADADFEARLAALGADAVQAFADLTAAVAAAAAGVARRGGEPVAGEPATAYVPALRRLVRAILRSDVDEVSPEEEAVIVDTTDAFVAAVAAAAAPILLQAMRNLVSCIQPYKAASDGRSPEKDHDAIANVHQLLGSSGVSQANTQAEFAAAVKAVTDTLTPDANGRYPVLDAERADEDIAITQFNANKQPVIPAVFAGVGSKKHATFQFGANTYVRTCLTVGRKHLADVAASAGVANAVAAVFIPRDEAFMRRIVHGNIAEFPIVFGADLHEAFGARADEAGGAAFGADAGAAPGHVSAFGAQFGPRYRRNAADTSYVPRERAARGPFAGDGHGAAARKRARRDGGAFDVADELLTVVSPSPTMRERWEAVVRKDGTDLLPRVLKQLFLFTRVHREPLQLAIRNNDVLPFGFLLFRPYMTYQMGSGILTVAGAQTGETLIGHADFQLADNVIQKMHVGNFTMYLKSVVYQQQNVYVAENIFAQGYVGGNGIEFYTAEDSKRMSKDVSAGGPSMYACLVPYESSSARSTEYFAAEYPNPIDITGTYSPSNPALEGLSKSDQMHYATSKFYSAVHRWDNSAPAGTETAFGSYNRFNTMVFQGHTAYLNPATGNYDLVQTNTGHWGPRVYPGCGKVRRGLQKMLEPVNYTSAFGDSAARVTIGY